MNGVVLVGRLVSDPEIITTDNNKKYTSIVIAIHRNYKNTEGIYETDYIRCTLWNGIASSTSEFCHAGDIVGIKGRLESNSYIDENQKKKYVTDVIAERVTFINSNKKEKKEIKEK
jgi:single-strand DNA-binding protein